MAAEKNNIGIKSFLSVPQEIFEQIIGEKSLELHDLFQLLLTCKWINNCLNSNELWKVKLLQRYCSVQRQSAVHTTHVVVFPQRAVSIEGPYQLRAVSIEVTEERKSNFYVFLLRTKLRNKTE